MPATRGAAWRCRGRTGACDSFSFSDRRFCSDAARLRPRAASVCTVEHTAPMYASAQTAAWVAASLRAQTGGNPMSIGTIVLVIVILMLVGVLPVWPHARSWGY